MNTIKLNDSRYSLKYRKEDACINFNVEKMYQRLPGISIYESLDDSKMFEVVVITKSVGELDADDLEFYIEEMLTAFETIKEIKQILEQDFDLEVIYTIR